MIKESTIELKCPKCGSKNFDCYDTDFDMKGTHWDFCYCEDCGTNFDIRYVAVEIESRD